MGTTTGGEEPGADGPCDIYEDDGNPCVAAYSTIRRLRAEYTCRLGAEGNPIDRDALLPDYLREPDAVPRQR